MAIIRFFASIKEKMGVETIEIRLPRPTPLRQVLEEAARTRGLPPELLIGGSCRFAVNQEVVGLEAMASDDDEIAALPPMSGGI